MIEVKVIDKEVILALQAVERKTKDLRPVFAELGEILIESVKERFSKGRGPDGKAWAANKPSTIAQLLDKTKGNFRQKTVTDKAGNKHKIRTGKLTKKGQTRMDGKKPLIGESRSLSGGIHYKATAASLRIGSSRIYSRVQQFGAAQGAFGKTKRGAPIPWGPIPARPYLGFSAHDKWTIADIVRKHLDSE